MGTYIGSIPFGSGVKKDVKYYQYLTPLKQII